MKTITNNLILILMVLIGLKVSAQSISDLSDQNTAIIGYDLDIKLSVDQAPELYKKSNLTIELMAKNNNIRDLKVAAILSSDISVNTSNINKTIDMLSPENPYQNNIDFVVNQPGQHMITIKVTGYVDDNRYTDRYEYLYFTTSVNSAENVLTWDESTEEDVSILLSSNKNSPYTPDINGYIEVAMADENRNLITKKVHHDEYYANQKGQAGMLTVSGAYVMRNRENDGAYAYANSLVQLVTGVSGAHRAWSYTNSEGSFTFPAIANPGSDGIIVRVYSVSFLANGLGYGVCKPSVCTDNAAADSALYSYFYSQLSPQIPNLPDGANNIGLIQTPFSLSNSLRAMWINHDMNDAHAHLLQNSLVRGPFTAVWSNSSTDGNYYNLGGNIHFKSDVANGTNHTVLHELGHNVMYNAGTFPTNPSDCPNPHYVDKISGTQCAWTEGWASAFANLVNDDPSRCFAPSTSNCISYETDPSFDQCFPDWDCGLNSHQVEGHVTGALWDLYDTNNDGIDINVYGTNELYDTMQLSAYPAFLSWWSSWLAQGFPAEAGNSLHQNDIKFTQSYDIDLPLTYHSSNLDPVQGQSLTITVRFGNIGDISSVGTPITLYRSLIPVFNGFEPPVRSYDYGVVEPGDVFNVNYAIVEPNSGTVYYRGCYADQHGLDENSDNNCSNILAIEVRPDVIFMDGFD